MIKNKKESINLIKKKKDKCFQYTVTVALNHEEIKKYLQRIIKIKPFIDKYNCEGVNYTSERDDWEKFEKNNPTIALKVFYSKKEKIYDAYISKYYWNREKQVIILMIPNGERHHYIAVKKLLALLRRITTKHHGDFYCLYFLHSFRTENKLISRENKDFWIITMLFKTLKHYQYQNSDKAPFIIYADF